MRRLLILVEPQHTATRRRMLLVRRLSFAGESFCTSPAASGNTPRDSIGSRVAFRVKRKCASSVSSRAGRSSKASSRRSSYRTSLHLKGGTNGEVFSTARLLPLAGFHPEVSYLFTVTSRKFALTRTCSGRHPAFASGSPPLQFVSQSLTPCYILFPQVGRRG